MPTFKVVLLNLEETFNREDIFELNVRFFALMKNVQFKQTSIIFKTLIRQEIR